MPEITLTKREDGVHVLSFPYHDVCNVLIKRYLPTARFSWEDKAWCIPNADTAVLDVFVGFVRDQFAKDEAEEQVRRASEEARKAQERAKREQLLAEQKARNEKAAAEAAEKKRLRGAGEFMTLDRTIRSGDVLQRDGRGVIVLRVVRCAYFSKPEAIHLGIPEFARTSPLAVEYETVTPEQLAQRDAQRARTRRREILEEVSRSKDRPVVEGELAGRRLTIHERGWSSSTVLLDDEWLWYVYTPSWKSDDGPDRFRPRYNYGYSEARRIPATDEIRALFAEVSE